MGALAYEIAVLRRLDSSLLHGLHKHVCVRLAHEVFRAIIAIGDSFKKILDFQ
jgi:hypothetical protein